MNCYPLFIYLFFIILYIILFIYLFQPKLENIIYIFLFILTIISGFNTIMDMKKLNMFLNFEPLEEIFKDGNGLDIIKFLLFSPLTTITVFIFFMFYLISYFIGSINVNKEFLFIIAFLLFITNLFQTGIQLKRISLYYVLLFPTAFIVLSLLFIIVSIYKNNTNSTGRTDIIPFSQIDPSNSIHLKLSMIINIIIIICFFIYFILFYEENDKMLQYQLYTIIPITYSLSIYMLYIASDLLKKNYLGG